jgi:hypothetical protein
MSKTVNNYFNDFLMKLGERPLNPVLGDLSEEVLAFEISELEEKYNLSPEVTTESKEAQNAENLK